MYTNTHARANDVLFRREKEWDFDINHTQVNTSLHLLLTKRKPFIVSTNQLLPQTSPVATN